MAEMILNDETFEAAVLRSGRPVLVDLYAPWCGPCQALAPVVAELADEFDGKVTVAKFNTDRSLLVAARYRVSAIPTLLFFKGGELVGRLVGLHPKAAIRARLEALLAAGGP